MSDHEARTPIHRLERPDEAIRALLLGRRAFSVKG